MTVRPNGTDEGALTVARTKRWIIASVLIGIIPFAVYLLLYPRMPDMVPIHYDGGGAADRFVPKTSWELLLLAGLGELGLLFMLGLRQMLGSAASFGDMLPKTRAALWNVSSAVVVLLFSGIGISALAAMV
ncbi:DUF1648 domain-containing protein [Paenibacillus spiritus]|uniref:DUF1648 domain-containing protein n=1 Tax=Paenibacillus spiritus TaxID=2496557 RepID=A0A5J5G9T0_9BACL|nr:MULTISPECIES: DUF1648 domain-containing protein [Paenibacillus]KAA9004721.1 DUF1648 domain-containing protein [Paenibacillus spiritus]